MQHRPSTARSRTIVRSSSSSSDSEPEAAPTPVQTAPSPAAAQPPAAARSSITNTSPPSSRTGGNAGLAGGAVAAGVALFLATRLLSGGPSVAALEEQAVPLDVALSNGKPTVVEFYASWYANSAQPLLSIRPAVCQSSCMSHQVACLLVRSAFAQHACIVRALCSAAVQHQTSQELACARACDVAILLLFTTMHLLSLHTERPPALLSITSAVCHLVHQI